MKKMIPIIAVCLLFLQNAFCDTGLLFNVNANGSTLNIKTTISHRTYPQVGIILNTSGYNLAHPGEECTMSNNGFCLFSANDDAPKNITVTGSAGALSITLCLNGQGPLSCQLYTVNVNNAVPPKLYGITGLRSVNPHQFFSIDTTSGDTTLIPVALNYVDYDLLASDGILLYHWSGPAVNFSPTIFESFNPDMPALPPTGIPMTPTPTGGQVRGVVYKFNALNPGNAFLATSGFNWQAFTATGSFIQFASTPVNKFVKGMACWQGKVYAIESTVSDPQLKIYTLNPVDGSVEGILYILNPPGYTLNNGQALTINPQTGIFYAILQDTNSGRNLYTINPISGQATLVKDYHDPNFSISTLAFHPADPTC